MKARRLCTPASHQEWLASRRLGITGTDISAIVGENSYKTPLMVYVDKVDPLPQQEPNEAMQMGTYMEEPIVRLWAQKNPGKKMRKVNAILQHPKHDWMLGNLDRVIYSPKHEVLEAKLVGPYGLAKWGTDDDPQVPREHYLQVMWYMMVTGMDVAHVAAVLGGTKYVDRVVEYDPQLAELLTDIAHDFWHDNVLGRLVPAIDGSSATEDWLARMHELGKPTTVQIPGGLEWITRYREAKVLEKAAEDLKKEATNNIKFLMGEHEMADCSGCHLSWRNVTTNRFDTARFKAEHPDLHAQYIKPSTHRRLNIPKE